MVQWRGGTPEYREQELKHAIDYFGSFSWQGLDVNAVQVWENLRDIYLQLTGMSYVINPHRPSGWHNDRLREALHLFNWTSTNEGFIYWNEVSNAIRVYSTARPTQQHQQGTVGEEWLI